MKKPFRGDRIKDTISVKNKLIIIIVIIFAPLMVFSQGEWNKWCFGQYITLDFNSGNPVKIANNAMGTGEGTVSVSDSLGNLLFYSDGMKVWDRNNNLMPNGTGLHGIYGSEKAVFAVRALTNDSTYYLFTVGNDGSGIYWGLEYSIIDMRLNVGNGDVVSTKKNIPVSAADSSYNYLYGIRHHNNRDVWIVTKQRPCPPSTQHRYMSFLLTSSGLDTVPVISNTLIYSQYSDPGMLKISPDGTKFFGSGESPFSEFYHFNDNTGTISPLFRFTIQDPNGQSPPQYADFSRDNHYLYVLGGSQYPHSLYQFDATKSDSLQFQQSQVFLGTGCGAMQLAPDGKIYIDAHTVNMPYGSVDSMHIIRNPELGGLACNFQKNILSLTGQLTGNYSIPQFLQKYNLFIRNNNVCIGDTVFFSSVIWPPPDTIRWNFGDPASGINNTSILPNPSHFFSTAGNYSVSLYVRHNDNRTDTVWKTVHVYVYPIPNLGTDRTICNGDSTTFDAGFCSGCNYSWSNLTAGQMNIAFGQTYRTGQAGLYKVDVLNVLCSGSDTIQLSTTAVPAVTNSPLSKSICSGEATNINLTSNVVGTTFNWTASLTSGNITGFSADSGQIINQILINNGATTGIATYHITPKVGSCIGNTVDYTVLVTQGTSVTINITSSMNNVCQGTSVTFNAHSTYGGSSPLFVWKVNGAISGLNDSVFTYIPTNADVVSCTITSSNTVCISNNPATSNSITMNILPLQPVSVSVSGLNPVCTGSCVNLSATTLNGGNSPTFQWFINGMNPYTSSSNLTNGLVAYYPFNGNATDASGNGNNGIVTGAVLTNDRFGNANSAYQFNGFPDIINCGHNSSLQLTNSLTMALWFKSTDPNPTGQYLLSKSIIPLNYEYDFEIVTYQSISQFVATVGGINFVEIGTGTNPTINNWHFAAVTFAYPGYLKLFYDGSLIDSVPTIGSIAPTSQDLVIGCIRPTGEPPIRYFKGYIDDIRIYNRPLNNCELTQLYLENTSSFSLTPNNGDIITCTVLSDATCPTNNPATSPPITMTVNPNLPVGVSISTPSNPFCLGSSVTFTALPSNGGTPIYQWTVNGVNTGTNSSTYSYFPVGGDVVSCVMNSSMPCTSGNPAASNSITMVVNTGMPAGVTITVTQNPFCPGTNVTFTAAPSNGGGNPAYQWKVNGINVGTNSNTYSYNPINGDSVRCIMTSNLSCVTSNPASSSEIIMSGTLAPTVTFSSCFDTITTINAKPIKLKGGIPLGGVYSGTGVNSIAGTFTPSLAGIGTKTITYTYTNISLCSAAKTRNIIVQSPSAFSCGNNLTDIRDGKTYGSVQIGTQCWMAQNLNYGSMLPFSQDQRDNCLAERYCYGDNPINCTSQGGLYQWDEMMLFGNTPADQGFCPPAWHVPTENEWLTLFNFFSNNAMAGSPLKYTGFSGFNALLSGVEHMNRISDFQGFSTMFWSSNPVGSDKAWAHGMNSYNASVSYYPALRKQAFSIRCIHD
jgi:uncharacterized protein (TIGR02145 family)